uniref:RING-type domain-containing protein n=1 Tax=Varanus komodoensis TaxID=61221 RepID=A0A8D2Q8X4_VARKO
MTVAVVTRCGHFFHGDCLRKWFYVRGTCPLCHQPVVAGARQETPQDQAPGRGAEPALEGAEAPRPKSDGEAPVGQSAARTAAEPLRTGGPEPSSAAASGEQRRPSGTTGEPAESGPGFSLGGGSAFLGPCVLLHAPRPPAPRSTGKSERCVKQGQCLLCSPGSRVGLEPPWRWCLAGRVLVSAGREALCL